jgi:hypothetical protein
MAITIRLEARVRVAMAAATLAACGACRWGGESGAAVSGEMGACVPPATSVLAGLDLQRLRSSPLYAGFPPGARAIAEPLGEASYVVVAYDGKGLLVMARGSFSRPPAGATLAGGKLALAGAPEEVKEALEQRRSGHGGAPGLVRRANTVAVAKPTIWIVARGTATVPGGGDLANLNRLLHMTDYATVAARLDSGVDLDAAGICANPDMARKLEENTRGLLSLAAAMTRQADVAAVVRSAKVAREGDTVRITLSAGAETARELLRRLARQ